MKATQPARGTILVIESDGATRSGMKLLVEKYGYMAGVAVNEHEAASIASQNKYDLILYDTGIAPPESFAAAYKLSRKPELQGIPMIALSVHHEFSLPLNNPDVDNFAVAYISNVSHFEQLERLMHCLLSK